MCLVLFFRGLESESIEEEVNIVFVEFQKLFQFLFTKGVTTWPKWVKQDWASFLCSNSQLGK